ncbi:MAG: lysozyme [Phenylobacterium sp.]|uniref:lysozyme n=1 Tax=Phenylobacterium sp. TaxID=1871053 RepID=UPI00391BF6CF
MRHQVSKSAIDLIKRFEGFRPEAAQLTDGRWTIGYGHTQTARAGAQVSERDAEALLIYDLIGVAHSINEWTLTPLNQNQFDALCAFAFNIGLENFRHSSVLRRINEGALIEAACAMELWRKADFEGERIVVDALVRRRAAEKTLFLTPLGGWIATSTPLLPPKIDADRWGGVPDEAPVALRETTAGGRLALTRDEAPAPRPAPPREDESPVPAAVAATVARLQAIVPETAPPSEPEPAAESDAGRLIVEEPAPEPRQQASAAPVRTVSGLPPEPPGPAPEPPARPATSGPLLLLAAVGLILFAWALYFAFSADAATDGGLLSPLAISWFVGVVGIGCFGVAAYLLLERLGGDSGGLAGPTSE